MPSTMCSLAMMCSSEMDSLSTPGKIVGIVVGSTVGLAFLICISVIIYLVCSKRKPQTQVWAYPCPRVQPFEQPMPIFPYGNYPNPPPTRPTTGVKLIEDLPPAYEEIDIINHSTNKH